MNYIDKHDASEIKVGDTVIVKGSCSDYHNGWDNKWVPSMNGNVGRKYKVIGDCREKGFSLDDSNHYNYPYFCLEKINAEVEHKEVHGNSKRPVKTILVNKAKQTGSAIKNHVAKWKWVYVSITTIILVDYIFLDSRITNKIKAKINNRKAKRKVLKKKKN